MTTQIEAADITNWDSLTDIANSLEKRGLKRQPDLGDSNEIVLQLSDDEFVKLVEAGPGEHAQDFKPESMTQHTNFVATNDFEDFTFITRVRTWDQEHGRIKYQKFSFSKDQFTRESGEKRTVLEKLNSIEYGNPATIYDDIYDTRKVVKEFYRKFEDLRTDLVQEVSGIEENRGDAKRRYVQVVLDRMIFLYFIQEKRLLDHDKDYLRKKHDEYAEDGDVYEDFYHDLFFDALAEGRLDNKYGRVPHLNGGLFSKNPIEEEFEDAKLGETAEETNECFDEILDFLSDWNWNVDERLDIVDPKNLSPAVLGHIFEQTVNQKEMGAYYTPEDITGFMARRTIHPYLLDQLNEAVGTDYEELDEVFGFASADTSGDATVAADGGTITTQAPTERVTQDHVETLYFDVLKDARVLDPAVGSGAFLLAAQEVLLDIYMQCIEYFQEQEDSQPWELTDRIKEELEIIEGRQGNASLYTKREIILNNLYGVDIDDGAVEICKLRLWLSMVADIEDDPDEVEKLPNIDFNIRQGNSLIGFTNEREVARKQGDLSLSNFGNGVGSSVKEMFEDIITAVKRHKESDSAEEATNARKLAESRIKDHTHALNKKILEQFHEAGAEEVTLDDVEEFHPFHWVLEFATVYAEGGFDIVTGNPPWDQLRASRDDFFPKFDERFRVRGPDSKDEMQNRLLEDDEIAEEWEAYQERVQKQMSYFTDGTEYNLQSPTVNGRKDPNENNLSALFLERIYDLVKEEGYISQVLPNIIFNGSFSKDLRMKMLNEKEIRALVGFRNKGIFEDLDDRFRFGVVVLKNSGSTGQLRGSFEQRDTGILTNLEDHAIEIPSKVLSEFSKEARTFPQITDKYQLTLLEKILDQPRLEEGIENAWNVRPLRGLDRARQAHRFTEDESEGDYPVYSGGNFHQFAYNSDVNPGGNEPSLWSKSEENPEKSARYRARERAYNSGSLKKAIYKEFGGESTSKSQIGFVNDLLEKHRGKELQMEDSLPDFTEYRLVYRKITNSTNERTMIAAVIPPGIVCVDSVQTISPYEINPEEEDLSKFPLHSVYDRAHTDGELFAITGLLNSIPFDYLMRLKIETDLLSYRFMESQVPRLTEGDDFFNFISKKVAKLNCYGDEFEEMRERLGGIDPATDEQERRDLQAEIDAAAFHAYGLDAQEVKFILDDFHRVENPRLMDEEYFDMVFEKYDYLDMEGPMG
ncbi:Eco57I restriction-modification methylase domain-containing protein [Halorussus sp. AFM4]|uniref:Eco57I restriction-modification methylase domain-containing protein n=1 Tax=Halorussus sp. AFM4 TaxID=3421651 RepID=UPI003EC0A213